eukprot:GHVN01065868.1.p1 GENE.GHVN01065868.1~~GHVN01065868.1.p1  ORF type:complete len:164 (+),score=15.40 GHVN01065868.1:293-784(+)
MDMQNVEQLRELSPLAVRVMSGFSAVLYIIGSLMSLFSPEYDKWSWQMALISVYALIGALVVLVCEFSPLGLNYLMISCPFLGDYRGRGIAYIVAGSLLALYEGPLFVRLSAYLVLLSGLLSIGMHHLKPATPQSLGYVQDTSQGNFPPQYEAPPDNDGYGQL